MKKRFEKEFNSLFGVNVSILNSEPVMIGNPPIADILAFIQSEIDLALANRNKEIVEKIENTDFWKTCNNYFTPEQREYIINLITKDNE